MIFWFPSFICIHSYKGVDFQCVLACFCVDFMQIHKIAEQQIVLWDKTTYLSVPFIGWPDLTNAPFIVLFAAACMMSPVCGFGSVCPRNTQRLLATTLQNAAVVAAVTSNAVSLCPNSTPGSVPTFKCPRCPRAYSLSYTLDRHMKYECGVAKQFGCFKCGKRFSRKDILKAHISNTKLHCNSPLYQAMEW